MINVKHKKCQYENCMKHPAFNIVSEKNPLYCNKHKETDMINVISKRCEYENCMKHPVFNSVSESKPLYCNEHKETDMINVISKRCQYENCMKQPNFNIVSETKPLYCNKHKETDMINVKSKKCQYENCIKIPTFNVSTEKTPLYCFEHKKTDMINVKNKKCQNNKCKEQAIFGFLNKRPQFCVNHKLPDTINLQLENKCSLLECENEHDHIIENIKYCNIHIPNNQYCTVIKRLCKYCDMDNEIKYVCKECIKTQNKKEWSIVRLLRKKIDTPFEYNSSKMLNGCSKKRPDIYFELTKHCVIVEVDENQHNTYEDTCECARINEIVNGIGGKSVIIIRYNPDTIKHNGKKMNFPQNEKIDVLVETIKKELVKCYDEFIVKIIQLYYNDNYDVYQSLKEEVITDKVCV
jgi:hypothetical protein